MSEVDAAVSVCIGSEINKLKSVGIPLSHTNIGIFDPETNEELSYHEEGEVRISGPNPREARRSFVFTISIGSTSSAYI